MSWIQSFFSALPYFVILIGLLIFVHEGGHFLFAKLFKVKVHVFSLGFGPKLLGIKKGETLYKISLVPIGGYVKMLGEDPTEVVGPEDKGRAFGDKPKWQRFLIIIGGPVMNLIFPLFLYFGVGLTTTEVIPAEVGLVLPGMPAYEAGIRPGDTIVSIDGEEINTFTDLVAVVGPNHGRKIEIKYRRGDQVITDSITPIPTKIPVILDELETVGRIGVGYGYPPPLLGIGDPTSVVATAGLNTFDLVLEVDGKPTSRLLDFKNLILEASGRAVTLTVSGLKEDAEPPFNPFYEQFKKPSRKVTLQVPAGITSLKDIGIESAADFVAYVKPKGAAESIGLKRGDKLISLDGKKYAMGQIYGALAKNPDKSHVLAWNRMGEQLKSDFKPIFIPAGEAGELGLERDTYDNGFWGLMGKQVFPDRVPNPNVVGGAIKYAVKETWAGIKLIGIGMKLLVQGRVSMRSLGGPIMIGQLAGQAGQQGAETFFWMMGLISLNLGLLNLLPIPVLDGGQILFIAVETITRRPLSRIVKERVMLAGVAMILLLMVFSTWNDIARLVVG